MSKLLKALGLLIVLGLGGLAGVYGTDELLAMVKPAETQQGGSRPPARVTVTGPERDTLDDAFRTVATIRPARAIVLRPLAAGRVEEVSVVSGQTVQAGDPILRLDSRAAQADVDTARATVTEAEADYRRFSALADGNVAADARLEEAAANLGRARAALARAEAMLEDRRLTAPFSGVIGILDIDPGQYVDSATALTTLDDLSTVEAAFDLPERYFARAAIGQRVELAGPAYPDRSFPGEVSAKSPRIDEGTRTFALRATVDNSDGALASGMFMDARLVFDRFEALTLPDSAIISEGDATYVFTVADGTATRQAVEIGQRRGGRTAVLSGIESDNSIVLTGYDSLRDGAKVDVVEDQAAREAAQ